MIELLKTKFAVIAGGVGVALVITVAGLIAHVGQLNDTIALRETEVQLTAKAMIREFDRAEANAKAAADYKAQVDAFNAQASEAAVVRAELAAFKTSLLARIARNEDRTPVSPVIADTLGELRERFQGPGSAADGSGDAAGRDPR